MAKLAFNDRVIEGLPFSEAQIDYRDTATKGFICRVGRSTKTFQVVTSAPRRRITLGHYPAQSLKEARKLCLTHLGNPPKARTRHSYELALDQYLRSSMLRTQTIAEYERLLNRLYLKGSLSTYSTDDLLTKIDDFKETPNEAGTPSSLSPPSSPGATNVDLLPVTR